LLGEISLVSYLKLYLNSYVISRRYVILYKVEEDCKYCSLFFCEFTTSDGKYGVLEVVYGAEGIACRKGSSLDSVLDSMVVWYEGYDDWNKSRVPVAGRLYHLELSYDFLVDSVLSVVRERVYLGFRVVDARCLSWQPIVIQVWYSREGVVEDFFNVCLGGISYVEKKSDDFCLFVESVMNCFGGKVEWIGNRGIPVIDASWGEVFE
jgi:hypothetical protein